MGEARARELRALEAKNEAVLVDSHRKEALAVQQERNLIAREIHDVLAHSLTLIQVQSTAELVAARTALRLPRTLCVRFVVSRMRP